MNIRKTIIGGFYMNIRERQSGLIFCIPIMMVTIFSYLKNNNYLFITSILLFLLVVVFLHPLYHIFFYNTSCPSQYYAGYYALQNNYDPKAESGKYWDPQVLKASDVYKLYTKRLTKPNQNTSGFVFYKNLIGKVYKMDFYEYKSKLCIYEFHFDTIYPKNDRVIKKEKNPSKFSKHKIFIALNEIQK